MRWSDVRFDPPLKVLRQFAAVGVVVLGGLACGRGVVRGEWAGAAMLGAAGLGLGLAGLWRPGALRPVYVAAMLAAFPIGWLVSWVVLGLVYYGVFTPLAVVFRLTGRDPLGRRLRAPVDSYWAPKPTPSDPRRYLKQY